MAWQGRAARHAMAAERWWRGAGQTAPTSIVLSCTVAIPERADDLGFTPRPDPGDGGLRRGGRGFACQAHRATAISRALGEAHLSRAAGQAAETLIRQAGRVWDPKSETRPFLFFRFRDSPNKAVPGAEARSGIIGRCTEVERDIGETGIGWPEHRGAPPSGAAGEGGRGRRGCFG